MSDASSAKKHAQVPVGWGITGSIFLGSAMFIFPAFMLAFFGPAIQELHLSENISTFFINLLFGALLIGIVVAMVYAYGLKLPDIGLGRFKLSYIGAALLGVLVYFLLSSVISQLVGMVLPYDESQAQDIGFSDPSLVEKLFVFAALVVVAPFSEELLFRGFMFRGLRRKLPFWVAAIIVSVLFGLAHFQINVGLDVFALSLVLCYLREKTDSLWPCILLHASKNLIAFIILFVVGVDT